MGRLGLCDAMDSEPKLPVGVTYGGSGPGGEFYSKDVDDLHSHSLWTKGDDSWTAAELRAIAEHQKWLTQSACTHKNTKTIHMMGSEYETYCTACGKTIDC